jgi:nucleotide-binding universal stress UspA family protein
MVNWKQILCATDLSEAGDDAIRQADEWARVFEAELLVLHVVPAASGVPMSPAAAERDLIEWERTSARVLDRLSERVQKVTGRSPSQSRLLVERGAPAAVITRRAEELRVDLVVTGAIGETGLWRVVLGGVAESLLRHAHTSVLLARPRAGAVLRILVAVDFSEPSLEALQVAAEVARRRKIELVVVHALPLGLMLPPGPVLPDAIETLRTRTRRDLEELVAKLGVPAQALLVEELPGTGIPRVAESRNADMVVVGTIGHSRLRRLLLGSVAEMVVRRSPCSVLAVRAERRD